jgi:hypothetical protein
MTLSKEQLFQRHNDIIDQHLNTKDDFIYVSTDNIILDMSLDQFNETFIQEGGAFDMGMYMNEVKDFFDIGPQ